MKRLSTLFGALMVLGAAGAACNSGEPAAPSTSRAPDTGLSRFIVGLGVAAPHPVVEGSVGARSRAT
ncbi:MAG: hypothetical protein RIF41_24020, partial [Polyangiaceae bacterium]